MAYVIASMWASFFGQRMRVLVLDGFTLKPGDDLPKL